MIGGVSALILLLMLSASLNIMEISAGKDSNTEDVLDASISQLNDLINRRLTVADVGGPIASSVENELWLAQAYKNLGMLLQSKGTRVHNGGNRLQREALDKFNLALSMDKGRTVSLNVQIHFLKGILLKMMGFGEASLESYEEAQSYELSKHDKAAVYFNQADTLQMMGQTKQANSFFRKALLMRPCKTERYYQYVQSCKDLTKPSLTKLDWVELLEDIQQRTKDCQTGKNNDRIDQKSGSDSEDTEEPEEPYHGDDVYIDDEEEEDAAADVETAQQEQLKETNADEISDDDEDEMKFNFDGIDSRGLGAVGGVGAGSKSKSGSYLAMIEGNSDNPNDSGDGGGDAMGGRSSMLMNPSLYWALSIAAGKAGRSALAWWYLEQANSLEKSLRPVKFNREEGITRANQIMSAFTPDLLKSLSFMKGKSSRAPIFIVGFMRSGSTLLETMLDAHPKVWGMGEDSIFNANLSEFRNELLLAPVMTDQSSIQAKQQHLETTLAEYGNTVVSEMNNLAQMHLNQIQQRQQELLDSGRSTSTTILDDSTKKSGNQKKTKQQSKKNKLTYIVDKMLFNYRNIGFIHMVFPDALIINMMRDPLDTLFSCFRCKFDDTGLEWSLDMSDLVIQYVLYLEIIQHFRTVLPGRVLDLRYEHLVYHPEEVLKDLIVKKLKLKWDPSVLDFHASNRSVQTNSQSQVKQKLYTHSIGSWRKYQHQLQPMINELRKFIPKLREAGALPFEDKMNWALDPRFAYTTTTGSSSEATTSNTKKPHRGSGSSGKSHAGTTGGTSSMSDGEGGDPVEGGGSGDSNDDNGDNDDDTWDSPQADQEMLVEAVPGSA